MDWYGITAFFALCILTVWLAYNFPKLRDERDLLKKGCIRHKRACEVLAAELATQLEDVKPRHPELHGGGRPFARRWLEYAYDRVGYDSRDEWWGDEQPPEGDILKFEGEE